MYPHPLKVIVGPACTDTISDGIVRSISRLTESEFKLIQIKKDDFADGEYRTQIQENVRDSDVYIVQSTNAPEENYGVLCQLLQAAAMATAERVTAVMPYMGGLRQDRKDRPRVPITAKLRAQQIEKAMVACGKRHVMILHPHFKQVQGFFEIPSDILYPTVLFVQEANRITGGDFSNVVPLGPDVGSAEIAEHYRKQFNTMSYAIGDKRRIGSDKVRVHGILGDVRDKTAIVFDDLVDTAGSLKEVVQKATELGAKEVIAMITHGVLAGPAIERVRESGVTQLYITDSIMHPAGYLPDDLITVLGTGELIGEAIWRNNTGRSISAIDGMFGTKNGDRS